MNRIDRLTAILIQLQTKRVVKADEIANRFEISLRTVYRDVRALMEAGVPIGSEAGKGYFMVAGYALPPVMFTTQEAGSLLLAGKLVARMTDPSIQKSFDGAMFKIRAVLKDEEKDRMENLDGNIEVSASVSPVAREFPNQYLGALQNAICVRQVLEIEYLSNADAVTTRRLEPIGLFYYGSGWHVIAWCQLRMDYRDFRADRIRSLTTTDDKFDSRNLLSLREYLDTIMHHYTEVEKMIVVFDKAIARHIQNQKHQYGFALEEDLNTKVRMTFLVSHVEYFARWLLMFGKYVEVEQPVSLKETICQLIDELQTHHVETVDQVKQ